MAQTRSPLPVASGPFITRALTRLSGRDGDLMCYGFDGKRISLRQAWSVDELRKWEREEGISTTGIPTWDHWCSYVFGE